MSYKFRSTDQPRTRRVCDRCLIPDPDSICNEDFGTHRICWVEQSSHVIRQTRIVLCVYDYGPKVDKPSSQRDGCCKSFLYQFRRWGTHPHNLESQKITYCKGTSIVTFPIMKIWLHCCTCVHYRNGIHCALRHSCVTLLVSSSSNGWPIDIPLYIGPWTQEACVPNIIHV